jgi:hypothetical protein
VKIVGWVSPDPHLVWQVCPYPAKEALDAKGLAMTSSAPAARLVASHWLPTIPESMIMGRRTGRCPA